MQVPAGPGAVDACDIAAGAAFVRGLVPSLAVRADSQEDVAGERPIEQPPGGGNLLSMCQARSLASIAASFGGWGECRVREGRLLG